MARNRRRRLLGLIVALADRLQGPLGATGRWVFLIGAWGALFSSLLGVWRAVPYLFADFRNLTRLREARDAPADHAGGKGSDRTCEAAEARISSSWARLSCS